MPTPIGRRQALATLGTVSLGALVAACSNGDGGSAASTTASTPTTAADVTTTDGTTATVAPQTTIGAGTSALFDDAASCTVSPEMTEGPYYFDVDAIRADIREDREGTPLRLALRVRDAGACTPIANAVVDIWHCDALGLYSGFEAASTGGPGGGSGPTDDETYLRGAQVTNNDGVVEITTIYPGWYQGRTTHIHAKVHLDNTTALTTQLYFDDDITDDVYAGAPYDSDGQRSTTNRNDGIFDERMLLTVSEDGDGYLGVMTFDVEA
jgi:protocatechuate 3,4-dioxygenase beta subunit